MIFYEWKQSKKKRIMYFNVEHVVAGFVQFSRSLLFLHECVITEIDENEVVVRASHAMNSKDYNFGLMVDKTKRIPEHSIVHIQSVQKCRGEKLTEHK